MAALGYQGEFVDSELDPPFYISTKNRIQSLFFSLMLNFIYIISLDEVMQGVLDVEISLSLK